MTLREIGQQSDQARFEVPDLTRRMGVTLAPSEGMEQPNLTKPAPVALAESVWTSMRLGEVSATVPEYGKSGIQVAPIEEQINIEG